LQEKFEYKDKHDWTNGVFNSSEKVAFLNITKYFDYKFSLEQFNRPAQILEIGTHTGTSLINIIQLIPNSQGIGVDEWNDSLEIKKSFHKNIMRVGLHNDIHAKKGDPKEVFLKMTKEGKMFDFIFIKNCKSSKVFYTYIFFAWQILTKGGIIVINDYIETDDNSIVSSFEAVNMFFGENKNEYHVLYSGSHIFLEKLV